MKSQQNHNKYNRQPIFLNFVIIECDIHVYANINFIPVQEKKQMRNIDALNAPYNFFENAFITVLDCLLN